MKRVTTAAVVSILLTACSGTPRNYPGCGILQRQQTVRQACLDAAPGCALTVDDMKKHVATARTLERYCR